jgi:hypothetical protein
VFDCYCFEIRWMVTQNGLCGIWCDVVFIDTRHRELGSRRSRHLGAPRAETNNQVQPSQRTRHAAKSTELASESNLYRPQTSAKNIPARFTYLIAVFDPMAWLHSSSSSKQQRLSTQRCQFTNGISSSSFRRKKRFPFVMIQRNTNTHGLTER